MSKLAFAIPFIEKKLAELLAPSPSAGNPQELPTSTSQIRDRTAKVQVPRVITAR